MRVTPRTLVRWVHHRDMPALARRIAIVAALRDLPADLDAAVYAAADKMEVRAGDLRAALVPILGAIGELGIDARTAGALLEAKRG